MMQSTISTPATAMTPVVKYSVYVQRSGWSNWTAPAGGRRGRTTKKTQSTGVAASQRRGEPSGTGAPTELFFLLFNNRLLSKPTPLQKATFCAQGCFKSVVRCISSLPHLYQALTVTHTHTHAHAHTRAHAHTHTRTHAHTRAHTQVFTHTRAYTCKHEHECVRA